MQATPGHFVTWGLDGSLIHSTDVAGITFAPDATQLPGQLYLADSEIDELPEFEGNNIFEVSLDGSTVIREIASNNIEPTGITFNEFDGYFYVTNDSSKTITRYDSSFSSPLVTINTLLDDPSASDPEGITSDPDTGLLYVADGIGGGRQILVYDSNLTFQYSFDLAAQVVDPEGIAFDPRFDHLFVQSNTKIFEYSLNGILLEDFDIASFTPGPISPQGATFAPTSDPNDAPGDLALYLADGGIDNFPDGGIYEAIVDGTPVTQNTAPLVYAGGTQSILVDSFPEIVSLEAGVGDDGLPGAPSTLFTLWRQVSGPGTVVFGDDTAIDTTVSFPVAGTYVLRLMADDGDLITGDNATITVNLGTEVQVAASSDDAEEQVVSGQMALASGDLDMGFDNGGGSSNDMTVGLRFSGLDVPVGATITNAYVQFQADETDSVATSLTIHGEDANNPLTFSLTSGDITSRSLTTSSVSWSPPAWTKNDGGPDQRTPDISSVIQEIIDRPGWSSGDALAIIISGSGERVAETYDADPLLAPVFHVEFEPMPNVTIVESGGSTDVVEGGSHDTYTVVLDSVPTADVDITVSPDSQTDLGSGAGVPIVLNFTTLTAEIPQIVTVTALGDIAPEGLHTSTITHPASSTDTDYNGILISDVIANITDSPSADFDISNVIDGADFLAWQRGFGTLSPNATKPDGDADNDLDVDGNDLTVWQAQYGMSVAPLAAASAVSQEEKSTVQEQTIGLSDLEFNAEAVSSVFFATPLSRIALINENSARAIAVDNIFVQLGKHSKRATDALITNARRILIEESKIVSNESEAKDFWDRNAFDTEIIDAVIDATVGGQKERFWADF